MMEELKRLLQYAFQTSNTLTLPISGPGSAGMEACFVNLLEPGDKVVICQNGVFGGRMLENADRLGARSVLVEDEWGKPVDPNKLQDVLKAHPDARVVAFVHAETSTGALSDAATLTRIAHEHDCLAIVDAVTSLGGSPLKVDEWGIDAIYSGSQKCLSCPPGLSPVSFNARAVDRIKNRKSKVPSWFLDLGLVMNYWNTTGGSRVYHHTAPVNSLYALHEALVILEDETLEASWARHSRHSEALRAGLEKQGIEYLVDKRYRLPQLSAVRVPQGIDDAALRDRLLEDHGIEIGGGLGKLAGKIWRIGLMGHGCQEKNVNLVLGALAREIARGK
jgi:alanine-glyoxylate transaminase/serine-glyoxylate transaminase/serine-pyruvate transaminase